jgi:hypothetical protein
MTGKNILRRFVKLTNSSDLCFASSNHSLCYEEAIYHFFSLEPASSVIFVSVSVVERRDIFRPKIISLEELSAFVLNSVDVDYKHRKTRVTASFPTSY